MFAVDRLILVAGVLLVIGIASSKFSARLGVPVLVLFLAVGMFAGSEGIGGIAFEDYRLAHGVGTIALALILFDGGLRSPLRSIRSVWQPALVLATLGVLITSLITGLAAARILGISMLEGMLLGGIVGSTDAAAVFAVLRSGGIRLRKRLAATLEVESASNDPMAIFLTVGIIAVLQGEATLGPDLGLLFVQQMALGAIGGLAIGWLGAKLINRMNLEAAGMYPLLATGVGLVSFGVTAAVGGSGFLAVYLSGIVLGNTRVVFQRGIFFFHDAAAWLSQIVMFTVLGLLSFPSRLIEAAPEGLLIAIVLVLVARPIAVLASILPFGYDRREVAFISWTGLKGAVPITLATFPLMLAVPIGPLLFDVVFFVVLLSAVIQGVSLSWVARRLGLELPPAPAPPISLELTSLRNVNGDIVDYTIAANSRAAGRQLRDLALPDGVVVAILSRGDEIIPPKGTTSIQPGDHAFVVLRPGLRPLVDRVFARRPDSSHDPLPVGEFPLRGATRVSVITEYYGIAIVSAPDDTLADLIARMVPIDQLRPGTRVNLGDVSLVVREMDDAGFAAFIVTQINVDGAGTGPDVGLYVELLETVETDLIASGGVGSAQHLRTLAALGAETKPLLGAIVGKALYDGSITIDEALAAAQAE